MGFTFFIGDLRVFFPYDSIYPEQYRYMCELKRALDAKGNSVLEMPTGTGKTVTLFSLITSYQWAHPEVGRLVYCTRTVPEMSKALEELRKVIDFRVEVLAKEISGSGDEASPAGLAAGHILAVGLSARRNMCVHPEVSKEGDRERVDEMCRQLTAPWAREKGKTSGCAHFEKYEAALNHQSQLLETGIYTIEDLRAKGLEEGFGWCPYYAARRLIHAASVVVLNYQLPGLKRTCTLLLMLLTFPANLTHGYNGCSICFTCRFCASLTHCHPRSSLPFFPQRCEVCPRLPLLTSQYSRRYFVSFTPARYVLDPKVSLASSLGGAPSLPGARRQGSHESHKGIQGYPNVSKGIQGYLKVSKDPFGAFALNLC